MIEARAQSSRLSPAINRLYEYPACLPARPAHFFNRMERGKAKMRAGKGMTATGKCEGRKKDTYVHI